MKSLLMGLLLLVSSQSFAGPRIVGNGGVGVESNGHLYMLDLYERGIQEKAYYAPDGKTFAWVESELAQAFSLTDLQQIPMQKLVRKVNEVIQKKYYQGIALHESLKRLDWRIVKEDLVRLDDVKTPMDGLPLRQIAVRQENVVFINLSSWNQLDEDNKVALLIHEAFYFLAEPLKFQNGTETYYEQSAAQTRSITGLIFAKRFALEGFTKVNSTYEIVYFDNPGFYRMNREVSLLSVRGRIQVDADFDLDGRVIDLDASEYGTPESLKTAAETAVSAACSDLARQSKGKKNTKRMIKLLTAPLVNVRSVYSTTYQTKTGEMQPNLKISEGGGSLPNSVKTSALEIDISNLRQCVQALSSEFIQVVNTFKRYND
jgi:hypothetical protein